eukprot:7078405-Prymnesium_polylepis.1
MLEFERHVATGARSQYPAGSRGPASALWRSRPSMSRPGRACRICCPHNPPHTRPLHLNHTAARLLKMPRAEDAINTVQVRSQFWQDALLTQIFSAIGALSGTFVEFGARRPNVLNSAHFRVRCGWCGLLLDGHPDGSEYGRAAGTPNYRAIHELSAANESACVRLRRAFLTVDTVNQ